MQQNKQFFREKNIDVPGPLHLVYTHFVLASESRRRGFTN